MDDCDAEFDAREDSDVLKLRDSDGSGDREVVSEGDAVTSRESVLDKVVVLVVVPFERVLEPLFVGPEDDGLSE